MSRLNLPQRNEGHRFDNVPNNDLDQRLTYQQLLNMNHDLSKQNRILQNTSTRLGQQLRNLHTQFDIRPREENVQLYNAIGAHPILHQYENTLVPLLDAYQYKIQQFEHGFEIVHEQFFSLEKKFQQVCKENEDLRTKLTDTKRQLLDVYRNGGNQKMHSDFGKIILDQINQKQKALVQQNARLQRDYQKYKAESQRGNNEIETMQKKFDDTKSKLRQAQISLKQLQTQNTKLKESSFELQIKSNQIEAEKRKLEQAHERAQSQNNQLNKQKQMYKNRLEDLKSRIQRDTSIPTENDQGKLIEQLQTKIAFLEAEQGPSDFNKKFTKLQKDYDALLKQKYRLKEALDSSKIREDQLNETILELKGQISKVSTQKSILQKNQGRVNKSLETLAEKSKNELIKAKKQAQQDIEKIQFELKHKIDIKDKKIAELDEALDKIKLEKDRIEKQYQIFGRDSKQPKQSKDSERALTKMKEKMIISEDLFKEQLQIFENDLTFMKKQADTQKKECQDKTLQLNKLKAEYDQLRALYQQVSRQKQTLVQEFKRVRNQYEDHLKVKEQNFEQKIRQIKLIVQQSDNKRRLERERVQQATQNYKRVLQDIKQLYQARIRQLQNQVTQVQYVRTQITPH